MRSNSKGYGVRSIIEKLETRQLMSVVNVTSAMDAGAIQNAIDRSGSGDTVHFGAGTYNIGTMLNLQGGRTYTGDAGTNLNWTGGSNNVVAQCWSGANINNLTFTGGCLLLNGSGYSVTNNTFQNNGGNGIKFGGLSNSDISHNTFNNFTGEGAIYGAGSSNVSINYNRFDKVGEAIHLNWNQGPGHTNNTSVEHNVITNATHYAMEMGGDVNGLDIGNNWVDNWVPQQSQIGLSIATGGSGQYNDFGYNVNIHDNYIGGNNLRTGSSPDVYYSAVEGMGQNLQVYNNTFAGPWGLAVLYGWTSSAWKFYNNTQIGLRPVNGLNPAYRDLIRAFRDRTGVGGVLNTSFNLHGYPIVGTPEAALDTLRKSDLDCVALGSILVHKG